MTDSSPDDLDYIPTDGGLATEVRMWIDRYKSQQISAQQMMRGFVFFWARRHPLLYILGSGRVTIERARTLETDGG